MRKIFLTILQIAVINTITIAQPKELLREISERLLEFKTYKSTCKYTFSFPYGGTECVESEITYQKEDGDSICGCYYSFITNKKDIDIFGDFSIYFKSYTYKSYKGVVDKILNVKQDLLNDKLNIDLPAKRPVLFGLTPSQIAITINNYLKRSNCSIIQKKDTLIEKKECFYFIIADTIKSDKSTIKTIEFCFEKNLFSPVFYRAKIDTSLINQGYFTGSQINLQLPINYFSEENLLPKNWMKKEKKNNDTNTAELTGAKAPNWTLPILGHDKFLSLTDLKGKFILIEFTATWCGVCNVAAETMGRIENHYKSNSNLEIVLVFSSKKDDLKSISNFTTKYNLKSTILYNAKSLEEKYHISGYPNYFIISPSGKILNVINGYGEGIEEHIIGVIDNYLK